MQSFVFPLVAMLFGLAQPAGAETHAKVPEKNDVQWEALRELDLKTGKPSSKLAKLSGQSIKIMGYMVPLEVKNGTASEFLLIPNPMGCVHVPPPAPNQIVLVQMNGGKSTNLEYSPVTIAGKLSIDAKNSADYGNTFFEVKADTVEVYEYGNK